MWVAANGDLLGGFAERRARTALAAAETIRELRQKPKVLPVKALPHGSADGVQRGRSLLHATDCAAVEAALGRGVAATAVAPGGFSTEHLRWESGCIALLRDGEYRGG
jgi:hypothetical protein